MLSKFFWTLVSTLVLLSIFLIREYWLWKNLETQFLISQKEVIFQDASGKVLSLTDQIPENLKNVLNLSHPKLFFEPQYIFINNLEVNKRWISKNFEITRFSHNFWLLRIGSQRIFWITRDFEFKEIISKPINLESDIWIIQRTVNLEKIPLPKELIILTSQGTQIGKNLKQRVIESQLPLLQSKKIKTGLLQLEPLESNKWKLKTF